MPQDKLNEREHATIMAALRIFQKQQADHNMAAMDQFYAVFPLTNKEINTLYEKINFEGLQWPSVTSAKKR